ncbi:MAG: T9SS type A sorting domain-containing protein [Candidatus Kapaibacteriota bacterium]|jgi:uncharacterized delta-60 repeat protein
MFTVIRLVIFAMLGLTTVVLQLLSQQATIDTAFVRAIGTGVPNGAFLSVITTQRNGGILLGGNFTTFNGVNAPRIVRLLSDGTIDRQFLANVGAGFQTSSPSDIVQINSIVEQSDGKILIGGFWSRYNNMPMPNLILRLNADGTLDTEFSVELLSPVQKIALQSDGTIIALQSRYAYKIAPDGRRNLDFFNRIGTGIQTAVSGDVPRITSVTMMADNSFLVGGGFATMNNRPAPGLVRITTNGDVDGSFQTNFLSNRENKVLLAVIVGRDGKIAFGTEGAKGVVRLNPDGSPDNAFQQALGNGLNLTPTISALGALGSTTSIYSMALQRDNKILIGGIFSSYNGRPYNGVCRINNDGTLDTTFSVNLATNADEAFIVRDVVLQNDNKVLLYGIGINRRTSAIRYVFTRLNATVPTGVRDNSTGSHIEPIVTISPNPIANMATIEFDMPQRQYLSVNIYNSLGVEVVRLTENTLTDGKQRLHWMTSGLTSGVYFVRVVMGSTIYSKSVIVGEF